MKLKSTFKLSLIALFTLSIFACDEFDDILDIDVPQNFEKTARVLSDQAKDTTVLVIIDPSVEEIQEYKDRVKEFTLERLTLQVNDRIDASAPTSIAISLTFFGANPGAPFFEVENSLDYTSETDIEIPDAILEEIEGYVENFEPFAFHVIASSEGPVDFDAVFNIYGLLTVSPESNN
ncbi:hypothetical protein [Marivirga arenosa]|uniref:DUF1735 domain-containing protein n=1 Tax=Marivirga arenosa TaxID=3059076 RepID=A0AA51X3P5_9BACT|nr:hypothetical protein [Marivirga sp. BKB1-2]WNB17061.1 hypothetical protein QYS47_32780 [Marivirga sp. BKB1-2]